MGYPAPHFTSKDATHFVRLVIGRSRRQWQRLYSTFRYASVTGTFRSDGNNTCGGSSRRNSYSEENQPGVPLEGGRGIHPEDHGCFACRVEPAMATVALKPEA